MEIRGEICDTEASKSWISEYKLACLHFLDNLRWELDIGNDLPFLKIKWM